MEKEVLARIHAARHRRVDELIGELASYKVEGEEAELLDKVVKTLETYKNFLNRRMNYDRRKIN